MKKVDLDAVLDEESFEEVSEECAFTVEGGCGEGRWPWRHALN